MSSPIDRTDLQRVIAIINNKGGVGKTTITANVGGLLANSGWRVLLVDLDAQGDLGIDLGYQGTPEDDNGRALAMALTYPGDPVQPLKDVRPNLDVLVGGNNIALASAALSSHTGANQTEARLALARALAPIAANYDIILIDCPPENDVLQSAAIAAARYILIPSKSDKAGVKGIENTTIRFDKVVDLNPDVDLLGVVLFATGKLSTQIRATFIRGVERTIGAPGLVFDSFVPAAEGAGTGSREVGLLVHELEEKVKKAPHYFERIRKGIKGENPGPASAGSVAEGLQAVTAELVAKLAEKEAANV